MDEDYTSSLDAPYKDSPDAYDKISSGDRQKQHREAIKALFNTPESKQTIFTGAIRSALGESGQQAVHVGSGIVADGFSGYPWIQQALSDDGINYDVAIGADVIGKVALTPLGINQLSFTVQDQSDHTKASMVANVSGDVSFLDLDAGDYHTRFGIPFAGSPRVELRDDTMGQTVLLDTTQLQFNDNPNSSNVTIRPQNGYNIQFITVNINGSNYWILGVMQ